MIQIRPVSDLRNKFPDIEKAVGGDRCIYVVIDDEGEDKIMEVRRFLYNKQDKDRLL